MKRHVFSESTVFAVLVLILASPVILTILGMGAVILISLMIVWLFLVVLNAIRLLITGKPLVVTIEKESGKEDTRTISFGSGKTER